MFHLQLLKVNPADAPYKVIIEKRSINETMKIGKIRVYDFKMKEHAIGVFDNEFSLLTGKDFNLPEEYIFPSMSDIEAISPSGLCLTIGISRPYLPGFLASRYHKILY